VSVNTRREERNKNFALRLQSYVLVHWAIAALFFKMYKQRKREKHTHTDRHTHTHTMHVRVCIHAGVALMSASAAALGVSSPPPSPAPPPFSALTSPSAVLLGKTMVPGARKE